MLPLASLIWGSSIAATKPRVAKSVSCALLKLRPAAKALLAAIVVGLAPLALRSGACWARTLDALARTAQAKTRSEAERRWECMRLSPELLAVCLEGSA